MSLTGETSKYANKRSAAQKESDYSTIASLYLRRQSLSSIAERLGLSRPQISHDLKKIQQRWRDASLRDFDEHKAEELAKIDDLECEYWSAWRESKSQRRLFRTKRRKGSDRDFKDTSVERENQCGDPRFLQGVERCIEQRCKILGLYAPTSININELDSLLARELARIAGADQAAAPGETEENPNPEVSIH